VPTARTGVCNTSTAYAALVGSSGVQQKPHTVCARICEAHLAALALALSLGCLDGGDRYFFLRVRHDVMCELCEVLAMRCVSEPTRKNLIQFPMFNRPMTIPKGLLRSIEEPSSLLPVQTSWVTQLRMVFQATQRSKQEILERDCKKTCLSWFWLSACPMASSSRAIGARWMA
jgi:hypothetical protein